MDSFLELLKNEQAIVFGTAIFIFLLTFILSITRVIGIVFILVLLILAASMSLAVSHYKEIALFSENHIPIEKKEPDSSQLKSQLFQAIDEIKTEISHEKEAAKKMLDSVQGLAAQMEAQKQKLQAFIEETRERFLKLKNEPIDSEEQKKESIKL